MQSVKIKMESSNAYKRHFFYKSGKNATTAAAEINTVHGEDTVSVRTAQKWFSKFRSFNCDVEDALRAGPPEVFNSDALLELVEAEPLKRWKGTAFIQLAFSFFIFRMPLAVSLLLALLSLIFLLKISPNAREDALTRSSAEDFVIVYDVTLALCALSLSLNLCCLLVCAIQFLFAVKLVRSPMFDGRDNKYLEKSSASRTCAVGGFFISIPIFLTGIILYTFNHFHSTPAIITSVLIGIGIVFCGGAMVHNVFIWQKEKTISYRSPPLNMSMMSHIGPITPPTQFLSPHHTHHFMNYAPQMHAHTHSTHAQPQTQLGVASTGLHPTSVTPVSPNHSHGSFNALLSAGALNSSFLMRPSTATPPTPKPLPTQLANGGGCLTLSAREASGSVSPGIPGALDMSNITSPSLHELSTLV